MNVTEQQLRERIQTMDPDQYKMISAHQMAKIVGTPCDDDFQVMLRKLSEGDLPVLERWATFFGMDDDDSFDLEDEDLEMLNETGQIVHPHSGVVIDDPGVSIYYAVRAPEPSGDNPTP